MNFAKSLGPVKNDKAEVNGSGHIRDLRDQAVFHQAGNGGEITPNSLSALLERVSGTTSREIDDLIDELQLLRRKLQTDGNRLQREITEFAALSQSVMQLTKIVSDSVKKLPDPPNEGG